MNPFCVEVVVRWEVCEARQEEREDFESGQEGRSPRGLSFRLSVQEIANSWQARSFHRVIPLTSDVRGSSDENSPARQRASSDEGDGTKSTRVFFRVTFAFFFSALLFQSSLLEKGEVS